MRLSPPRLYVLTQPSIISAGLNRVSVQVRQVKEKIAQEKGEYEAERMKVIYSGKIPLAWFRAQNPRGEISTQPS